MKLFKFKNVDFWLLFFTVIFFIPSLQASVRKQLMPFLFGTSSVGSAFTPCPCNANVITKHSGITATVEPVGGLDATVRE